MVVQHNLTAMNSNRMLGLTTKTQAKSTEKLSSGYKINRAADDAAGLAISEKMRKQIRGLTQASSNAQDGISAVQTAEGALTEVHDMLQRMNELAIKAGNGTMSESDRQSIQDEMDQLITEIDRVSETTKFNETYLLRGSGDSSRNDTAASASIKGGAVSDGKIIKATGNIYAGTIDDTDANKLASGTEDKATITYLDAEGNQRIKEVTFVTGANKEATAANLAEEINKDDDLKKIFTASSDKNGKLTIESKLDGNKTDDTKNAVTGIEFTDSKDGARKTAFVETDIQPIAAKQESYEITLGTGNDVAGAAAVFVDGSSVTIGGKTYTYDEKKAAANTANSFKSLEDLQKLLGDSYEVELVATATAEKTGEADAPLSQSISAGDTEIAKLSKTEFDEIDKDHPDTGYTLKAGSVSLTLKITKKADVEQASDALNFSLQVGADTTAENKISIDIESMSAKRLGIENVSVAGKDSTNADAAVNTIADAIAKVSAQRSALGAVQNRLEHTINNLDNVVENTTSAESQIRDTDMASEMVKYANNQILAQAGQAMLAQANQANQGVLSLLG